MSIREQLTLAAGVAVALATSALFPIYQGSSWVGSTLGAIGVVVASGLVTRRLGVPRPLQPLVGLLALAAYLLVVFVGSTLADGVVPTGQTWTALQLLWQQAQSNIQHYGPPVPVTRGLVLLTAAGVGAVAVVTDFLAVVLDRAAVAGLPLLVLLAVPSAVLPGGIGGLPFVLGAIGWLGLLLVEGSERVGRWGMPMRSAVRAAPDDSSLGRVGRRIGVAAVGAAVIVPWLTPGLDHRLVGGGDGLGGAGGKGGPVTQRTYNPITKLAGYLDNKERVPLFDYVTDDPTPDYIRMTTLDTYDHGTWRSSELRADPKKARVRNGIPTPSDEDGDHRSYTMTVALRPKVLTVRWLPVPYGPKKIDVDVTWLWEKRSQTVFSAGQTTADLQTYKVQGQRALPDATALEAASLDDVSDDIGSVYQRPLRVDPYVSTLTDQITRGKASEYDEAVAIQDYFTRGHGFVYDLQASRPVAGQDALVAFLQGKHGFCEQYATAMAVLLREAGIPSRVAVGFTAGSREKAKNGTVFYEVTTQEAHAWPEAWFAGTGWVRFEPTPQASGASIPSYAVAAANVGPGDPATSEPDPTTTNAPKASATLSPDILSRLEDDKATGPIDTHATTARSSAPSFWVVAPVLLAVLLVLPALLTLLRRRLRWADAGPLTAWEQLHDDATDVGWVWRPADSPRAAAARLGSALPLPADAQGALLRIASATERARYAPPESQQREELAAAVGTVRAALQAQASRSVRLRAALFPLSTLRWAGSALGTRLGRIMDAVDDAIAAVTRPVRRRAAPH